MAVGQTAALFPGQGGQGPWLRDLVARHAGDLLDHAAERLRRDPFAALDQGTAFVQPAVYCASLALFRARRIGERATLHAGHSFGEFAALATAGAVSDVDGLEMVLERGRLTAAAAAVTGEAGGMMAVGMGLDAAGELAERFGLVVAVDNSPEQTVLSGPADGIGAALKHVRRLRVRCVRLEVDGAFHSPAMQGAVAPFREFLTSIRYAAPDRPVFSSLSGREFRDPAAELANALVAPVRWRTTMRALQALGVRDFVDVGPGCTFERLVLANLPDAAVASAQTEFDEPGER